MFSATDSGASHAFLLEEVGEAIRLLQENSTDDNETSIVDDDIVNACDEFAGSTEGPALRNTLRLYGGIFIVILTVFCYVRRRFPKVYNLRNYVEDLKTDLAMDQRGSISWMWRLFGITDMEMLNECGMDALCYARVLEFGAKLSLIGMLNSLWLIPVYATAESDRVTDCIKDPVLLISISHLPSESMRFVATVLGAYVIFGCTMYSILGEFDWFIRYRHRFLSKKLARNYSVYVQCIPPEYRSNKALKAFFEEASAKGVVLDAHVALKIPNLEKKVAERETVIANLEHAINQEEINGITPQRKTAGIVGTSQSLIDVYFDELRELNQYISSSIDLIENQRKKLETSGENEEFQASYLDYPKTILTQEESQYPGDDDKSKFSALSFEKQSMALTETQSTDEFNTDDAAFKNSVFKNSFKATFKTATNVAGNVKNVAGSMANKAGGLAGNVAGAALGLLSSEDGKPHSAAFVTFKTLRSAQAAMQMLQYSEPFAMEVLEAPQPEDVYWGNVGKTHQELQVGKLFSFALTTTLCVFWTIPMGFISTLSSVEGLRGELDFIDKMLTNYPWTEAVLAQLAPLLIVVANEVLVMILELMSGLEGPISGAVLQAGLFTKLASFMIIQTFFVTAIGGSITAELSAMINDPTLIVDLLATTLPSQSTFYVQILLVDTCLSLGIELLRAVPLAMAGVRSLVGPRLTEKERSTTWMGLRPLCDPVEFKHANLLSGSVLYFMVFFVYAALAPLTTYFMFACFLVMSAGYRHQFVHIYPTFPDSGGKLWVAFMRIVPVCMIIAQVTIVGMLALNKAAVASAMMFPLLIITILFSMYIRQKHFAVADHLPSKDCIATDAENAEGEMNYEFVKDKYIQPGLREREVLPENVTVEREMRQGGVQFVTPPGSASGGEALEV